MSSHENLQAERIAEPGAASSPSLVSLELKWPIWERFFTVAPLMIIGTRDETGAIDLAPKHMATPLGWQNYFGFVCTPRHRTYQNISREGVFTVSFPRPSQVVLTSLSAAPRDGDDVKPALALLPTRPARTIDGVFVEDGYLFLECKLDRIVDGFGENSLIAGRVVAAQVAEDALRLSDREDGDVVRAAPLLVYLAPGCYAEVCRAHAFPYPVGFTR
jgi:flavin reductase (DIM6/NTAB) family NADH-FMN oxidoreductase RutF